MKIICVGGSASNTGKTQVCEILLRNLPNLASIKVTTIRHSGTDTCPRQSGCRECMNLPDGYLILDAESDLEKAGKDTLRMKLAGAKKVLWLKSVPEKISIGFESAFKILDGFSGVVIEGNSPALCIKDCLKIFIYKESETGRKESAEKFLSKADIVLLGKSDCESFKNRHFYYDKEIIEYSSISEDELHRLIILSRQYLDIPQYL